MPRRTRAASSSRRTKMFPNTVFTLVTKAMKGGEGHVAYRHHIDGAILPALSIDHRDGAQDVPPPRWGAEATSLFRRRRSSSRVSS